MNGADYKSVARDFLRITELSGEGPDLSGLAKMTRAFGRLPYENLTKIIRAYEYDDPEKRMRTPDVVLAEHFDLGAGGTCFSLTYFFQQVLNFVGFDVYPVFCDRSYGPNTHCALIVTLQNKKYLVDPGYLMEAPLLVPENGETVERTKSATTKLARLGKTTQFLLFTERLEISKLRYRLRDVPVTPEEFRQRWIDSFDWAMMRHVCVSVVNQDGQLYMRDGKLKGLSVDDVKKEVVKDRLVRNVSSIFKIDPRIVDAACEIVNKRKVL